MSRIEAGIDSHFLFKSTQKTHLDSKDKLIVARVGFISDSESDWNYLELALSELKKQGVSDVFHLGDITHLGVSVDLADANKYFVDSGLKIYPIPGDRDLWKSRGIEAFSSVFGESYRVVDINGVKFLLINNADEYEGIDDVQMRFISGNISSSSFVLFHNPIYFGIRSLWGKGMGEYSSSVDTQRKLLLDQIRSTDSVSAVFAGDQHLFSENVDETRNTLFHYIIGSTNSERNIERPNLAILTVYDDGDYYVEKISF
ncbi:hypothetical protein CO058_00180 [candidate division WWE3 bacterium CG_4_9_14_0_2_um_filter_35_11]|uniref:Calcineurin-like phosphoesterase domain-containing protein n=1 Tax=candidate division WWE3 bacterium CG_4_9_14_0_2_um_filter_35_11 TaxID=1975077 RepID=A0A2M8EMT1_UNCKA|nr:MAG: hypothetical protein CO058_00180 [candidate division WWE3 bacterium CG_4_9_14_0_2_um_filter_35_11]